MIRRPFLSMYLGPLESARPQAQAYANRNGRTVHIQEPLDRTGGYLLSHYVEAECHSLLESVKPWRLTLPMRCRAAWAAFCGR